MTRARALALSITVAAAFACSGERAAELRGAVYPAQIPVYPGARYQDSMGGKFYGDIGGPVITESLSWFFTVADPEPDVTRFYETKLPAGSRVTDDGDDQPDQTVFRFVPAGASEGEDVTVTIHAHELQITEQVKPGKRPQSGLFD
ncbi:MAG: hypothetical protein U1E76_18680 [Planctomycetota bacterium]